jgi:hypothetical protein
MSYRKLSKEPSSSHISANELHNAAEKVSGEEKTAALPHLGMLHMIAEIRKADNPLHAKDDWAPIVNDQLRFFKVALKLCTEQPAIGLEYGTTMEGAARLVAILKARAAEIDLEEAIDQKLKVEILPHTNINKVVAKAAAIHASKSQASGSGVRIP